MSMMKKVCDVIKMCVCMCVCEEVCGVYVYVCVIAEELKESQRGVHVFMYVCVCVFLHGQA